MKGLLLENFAKTTPDRATQQASTPIYQGPSLTFTLGHAPPRQSDCKEDGQTRASSPLNPPVELLAVS